MSYYSTAIKMIALLACSSWAFAQAGDFGTTLKQAAEKQNGKHYFQAFDLYMTALKQASTPDEKERANTGVAAWVREQRRFYANNAETVEMLKKNLDALAGAALFEAGGVIARAYESDGDLPQAWEWHNKRLACEGISEVQLVPVREHMAKLAHTMERYAEAVKRHQPVIDDPARSKKEQDEARMRLLLAMADYPLQRIAFVKAAEAFIASQDVATEWKAGIFETLKNVYMRDRDWDQAAVCFRRYADLPGQTPANKARLLLMLGDVNWRQRHQLQDAIHVFREIVAIPNVPAKAKQDAETWLAMLTEEF